MVFVLLAAAGQHPTGSEAAAPAREPGPPLLRDVQFGQHKRQAKLKLSDERRLPPLGQLNRYPNALRAAGPHLCVALDGRATRRKMICLDQDADGGQVRLGLSRYFRNGHAVKRRGLRATVKRRSARTIELRFSLKKAGISPGRFRFFAVSGWSGEGCGGAPPEAGEQAPPEAAAAAGGCRDRLPKQGSRSGRIAKLVRAGCSYPGPAAFRNGPRSKKQVALTFDDGPSAYTPQILATLDRLGAKGTFFQVGNLVPGNGSLLHRILADGHELANHSLAHEQFPGSASMARTNQLIRQESGFTPCSFRPPHGAYNGGTVGAAQSNGMGTVLWDIDTEDYRSSSGSIYARAIRAGSGSIVLMHDGGGPRGQTAAALPRIITNLRSRGYRLVTVTELMGGRFKMREKR